MKHFRLALQRLAAAALLLLSLASLHAAETAPASGVHTGVFPFFPYAARYTVGH